MNSSDGTGTPTGTPAGFLKALQEQKLKSFSIGTMGKRALSKKEQEELRKKHDEEQVGKVYEEFVSTFEESSASKVNKTWVRAGTFNAGNRKEDITDKGKLYKPTVKYGLQADAALDLKSPSVEKSAEDKLRRPEKPGKKKTTEKKKSNLEIFKEELKAAQEERKERHRVKNIVRGGDGSPFESSANSGGGLREPYLSDRDAGSHDVGDPTTTNLYLGNLSPRLTEQQMMELFGRYGPLASIKIMWPRTEDEKSRGRNCGFVAYMSRKDAERAFAALSTKTFDGFEMRMGWGKPVPIPLHPIYIPPPLLRYTLPPPASGLPFNCQPTKEEGERWDVGRGPIATPREESERKEFNRMLYKSTVKVVIPTDRTQLCLINRVVEFVLREGPMFEAMIMNREMNNRNFAFLFDNQSAEHIYYRWRLFSLLQGESKDSWSTKEFRMFKGGSSWKPPPMNLYTSGMPEELMDIDSAVKPAEEERRGKEKDEKEGDKTRQSRRGLSDSQRDRFEEMLRNLYPDRNPIAEAMVWCLEHADAGEEIVECIAESLSILQTPLAKKIARLYLISDILHNCSVKGVPNVSFFRNGFQAQLPEIFSDLHSCYKSIESRMKAEAFKQRVMNCFRAWEDWALYPMDFLIRLQNIFLGLVSQLETEPEPVDHDDDDVDGKSLSDEDVDGVPLDGAALLKSAKRAVPSSAAPRHGGDVLVEGGSLVEADTRFRSNGGAGRNAALPAGFVPSRWETVDPEEVQAQAVTSKWDIFDQAEEDKRTKKGVTEPDDDDDDVDGIPMQEEENQLEVRLSEDRRSELRKIELKVMSYQDELEAGRQTVKPGWTISEMVEQYRKRLIKDLNALSARSLDDSSSATPRVGMEAVGSDDGTDDDAGDTPGGRSSRSGGRSTKKKRRRSRSRSRSRSRDRKGRRKRGRRSRSRSRSRSSGDSSGADADHRRRRSRRSRSRSRSRSPRRHKRKSRH